MSEESDWVPTYGTLVTENEELRAALKEVRSATRGDPVWGWAQHLDKILVNGGVGPSLLHEVGQFLRVLASEAAEHAPDAKRLADRIDRLLAPQTP